MLVISINVCMQLNPFVFRYSIETLLVRITMRRGERKLAAHYRHMPTHKHTYPNAQHVLFLPTLLITFLNDAKSYLFFFRYIEINVRQILKLHKHKICLKQTAEYRTDM